jgi:hypothetical protein
VHSAKNCKLIELLIIRLNSQCGHYIFRKKKRRELQVPKGALYYKIWHWLQFT